MSQQPSNTIRMSEAVARLAIASMAWVMVAGCGSAPVKRSYALRNDFGEQARAPGGPVCARTVVLAVVEAAAPYRDEKIVFRTDAYEVKHFHYRLWVTEPAEMLRSLVARKIERARLFTAVESFVHSASDHLTLYSKLHAVEENEGDDGWSARLAMGFVLKAERDERVVWEYEFDESVRVPEEEVPALIQTMNDLYNEQIDEALIALSHRLTTLDVCREE